VGTDIENFTKEKANTTVHRIYGQRATLSFNYKPGNWDSVKALLCFLITASYLCGVPAVIGTLAVW